VDACRAKKGAKKGAKTRGNKAPVSQSGKKKRKLGDGKPRGAPVAADKPAEEEEDGQPAETLRVKSDAELLASVYWLLLTRSPRRNCVVVLPNRWGSAVAQSGGGHGVSVQQLAGMFKHLGFQSLALHGKMTGGQRKANVERLAASTSDAVAADAAAQLVLVTTEHLAASAATKQADVILVAEGDASVHRFGARFAQAFQVVVSSVGKDAEAVYTPALSAAKVVQQLQARLKLARQIADISQRVGQSSTAASDDKWAAKMAKGAELMDSDDDGDGGRKQSKKKTKKGLTPDEQRLQALTDKLFVLLASPVETESSARAPAGAGDAQNRGEKLHVLGLVTVSASVGTAMTEERTSAQTQWMDGASAARFGGSWAGAVRHGASKDETSLQLRRQLCSCLETKASGHFLGHWRPNKQPSDPDAWGGAYGKVCGHNEVVLQALRPFFPQEVLNSKVCSRLHPAPGNQGFDGCLEHLRLACAAHGSPMTVWDGDSFVHISTRGRVTWTRKRHLLSLSLASLQCLVPALRAWTVASNGRLPPNAVLLAVQLCCRLGIGHSRSQALAGDLKVAKRIVGFLLGGSARLWKQIAAFQAPLECQIVYEEKAMSM
jgi:hypothetical protein